ncbi:MAG: nucleoside deaminase [Coprobacillaceae bacterium]
MEEDIKYMKLAYKEALKALKIDEVPIGAIVVQKGKIIAKAYNQRENKQLVTAHAEIMAIEKACKKLHTWKLDDCTLYTTLEPCVMCSGVIVQSRIKRVVFGAMTNKWLGLTTISNSKDVSHKPEIESGVLGEECSSLISNYFKDKR